MTPEKLGDGPAVEFPVMEIGTSIIKTFTISNVGFSDLEVRDIQKFTIPSAYGEDFSLVFGEGVLPCPGPGGWPFTLARNHNCTAGVEFSPTISGPHEAWASIVSNDLDEFGVAVHLLGTGVDDLNADIWSHDLVFRDIAICKNKSLALLISNTGGMALEITEYSLSDTANYTYDASGGAVPCASTGNVIPSTSYCTLMITFRPQQPETSTKR